jgi:hypothetical protein
MRSSQVNRARDTKGDPAYLSPAQELKLLRSLPLADIPEA